MYSTTFNFNPCADSDGVVFVPLGRADEVLRAAEVIRRTERAQADALRAGASLSR
jgi:regulator of RNase E activity RraA